VNAGNSPGFDTERREGEINANTVVRRAITGPPCRIQCDNSIVTRVTHPGAKKR